MDLAEVEPDGQIVQRFGLCDLGIILAMIGTAVVAQQGPGKQYILGAHRLPIRKARPWIEMESDKAPLVVGFHARGEQSVECERLVISPRHQAFDDIAALEAVAAHLLYGKSLDD